MLDEEGEFFPSFAVVWRLGEIVGERVSNTDVLILRVPGVC